MRGVIFDWGGVIVKTVDQTPRYAWEQRLGLQTGSLEAAIHGSEAWRSVQVGRMSPQQFWSEVARDLRLDPELIPELRYDFYREDRLDRGLIELIRALRAKDIIIGLLSNNSLELLTEIDALRLRSFFDSIVISAQIGVMKPAAAAYEAILRELRIPAHLAVMIDDFAENIRGARATGMEAIHYTPGIDLASELRIWFDL